MDEKTSCFHSPETMRTSSQMLIFDVDGVITNPQKKKVTEPEILDFVAEKVKKGEPVALNTGRSLVWLIREVINPLLERIKDKKALRNFVAFGEKGGAWLTVNEDGKINQYVDESITVPDFLRDKIRTLVKNKYSQSMFYDEEKLGTLISAEMNDGYSLDEFKKQQDFLVRDLKDILDSHNLSQQLKIDPTTIAVDIENKFVGKRFAVKRILNWMKDKGINPQKYVTFGDSFKSDIPMAQELHEQGLPVEFVYVGKDNVNASAFPFPIHQTQAKFEKGTLEFLKSIA